MFDADTSLAKFLNDVECATSIYAFEIVDEEQKELKMMLATGDTTPYAGAVYEVVFRFPESYPFGVPHATFGSPIWNTWVHPVNKQVHFDDSQTWNVVDSLAYVEGLIQKPDMDEFSTFFVSGNIQVLSSNN
ncbi:hypothetical protein B9Z55_025374 [Caenorhabditis nigoni]|uniref:UBC core domain-containing protein n=1 Tax=Caenorhabditis nigoni TaxID=1611254 RepID=A0A2G5SY46_9PELO|nr:hypothetical protein B9Z55_025374 [Caenorhabditis nigoni]